MEQGFPQNQVVRSNPGQRLVTGGITVRMVNSVHDSGLPAPTPTTPYGGPAAGFVITFENGWTIYFTVMLVAALWRLGKRSGQSRPVSTAYAGA